MAPLMTLVLSWGAKPNRKHRINLTNFIISIYSLSHEINSLDISLIHFFKTLRDLIPLNRKKTNKLKSFK